MSLLEKTLQEIREEHLPLEKLEKLRDTVIHLKTDLHRTIADFKKKRALFLIQDTKDSVAARKMLWDATEEGQRLLELQGMIAGLGGEIDALQTRIYSAIR